MYTGYGLMDHHTIFNPHTRVQPCVKAFVGERVVCHKHGQSHLLTFAVAGNQAIWITILASIKVDVHSFIL